MPRIELAQEHAAAMNFREPLLLVGLALLPLALAAYVVAQRRRRRYAVRYTNVDLLASVARPRRLDAPRPGAARAARARRAAGRAGRPERTVAAEQRAATVVMVTDTSGSMFAKDVAPDRLTRRQDGGAGAGGQAAAGLPARPDQLRHRGRAARGADDRQARVKVAVESLKFGGDTAMGEGLDAGIDAVAHAGHRPASACRSGCPPRSCSCPTARTRAARDPIDDRRPREEAEDPDLHVALGTQTGTSSTRPRTASTRAGAAGHRDAAGDRAHHRRALLLAPTPAGSTRSTRTSAPASPRFREAGGHGGVRGRRPRAAAGRRRHGCADGRLP